MAPIAKILNLTSSDDPVSQELRASAKRLGGVAIFSGVVNLLMLAGPLYMLQVYDRVIPSRSVATLLGLSAIILAIYVFQGFFDALRLRMLARIGSLFDAALQEPIHCALATLPLRGVGTALMQQPLRDLDQIRIFLSGLGPTAFLDVPWIPIFVITLFLFHPAIGMTGVIGAVAIVAIALLAERFSADASRSLMESSARRQVFADATRRNAEAIRALGMSRRFTARWLRANDGFLRQNLRVMDLYANLGTCAKIMRYALQSAMLGVGAYLVVIEQASGGIIIASSIMLGRALAPIEVALGTWKQFVTARQSIRRLAAVLKAVHPPEAPAVVLAPPERELSATNLAVAAPGSERLILSNVSFSLRSGVGLAVLGPSASGKSSLAKALVGVWPAFTGIVRLDGAAIDQWDADELGRHIGYLPQDVSLFEGSVAENIARLDESATPEAVLQAARIAGAHDMIVRLPQGYSTRIGEGGMLLSAGQRQRIGLARALFGDPFLIVLDEPNASLDAEGENALMRAIGTLRDAGRIVVVVSHRPNVLAVLDMALVLYEGAVVAFGPRDEILARAGHPGGAQPLLAKVAAPEAPLSRAARGARQ
jgi:PrtD family type I secretion system ABC transporter